MIEVKTAELGGKALDWAVAMSEGATNLYFDTVSCWWFTLNGRDRVLSSGWSEKQNYCPSTDWRYGGPLIERGKITVVCCEGDYNPSKSGTPDCYDTYWVAEIGRQNAGTVYGPQSDNWGDCFQIGADATQGPTPLIAAMRCLVAAKLGDTVQVPKELV